MRYRILKEIGSGTSGVVVRALHLDSNQEVALKLLSANLRDADLQRLDREIRVLSSIVHPNIVRILDSGVTENRYFYAMELLEGHNLEELMRERGPWPLEEAAPLVAQMADALACLHENGICHRDLKPANIVLANDGRAVLADFGLAKGVQFTAVTEEGALLGTPRYMSPEALKGQPAAPPRDVWALALVAHELVTGRPCYPDMALPKLIEKIVSEPPPSTRGSSALPGWFSDLLDEALSLQPAARPMSAVFRDRMRASSRPGIAGPGSPQPDAELLTAPTAGAQPAATDIAPADGKTPGEAGHQSDDACHGLAVAVSGAAKGLPPSLLARFEVIRLLGSGGQARVFLARHRELGRQVAVKIQMVEPFGDTYRNRLSQEARILAGLQHPNLVKVYELETEGAFTWLVAEYVEGRTLDDLVAGERHLDPRRTVTILLQILEGLGHLHDSGVLHRDLKPSNLILEPGGRIRILDFGLAVAPFAHQVSTATGTIVGTADYMPPEVARGEAATPRSDLYSLGVIAYRLLAGSLPFEGSGLEVLGQKLLLDPPSLQAIRPELPSPLASVIQRCIARKQEERPASARELAQQLKRSVTQGMAALSVPDKPRTKSRLVVASSVALALALSLLVVWHRLGTRGEHAHGGPAPWSASPASPVASLAVVPSPGVTVVPLPRGLRIRVHGIGADGSSSFSLTASPPATYPYTFELDGALPSTSGSPSGSRMRVTITGPQVGRALLDLLRELATALQTAPNFDELTAVVRFAKKHGERTLPALIEKRLLTGRLIDLWRTVADHAGPVLASDLDLATRDRLLDNVYRFEELANRLRSFRLPVPVDLRPIYPPRWRPGAASLLPDGKTTTIALELVGRRGVEPTSDLLGTVLSAQLKTMRQAGVLQILASELLSGQPYPQTPLNRLVPQEASGKVVLAAGFKCRGAWIAVTPSPGLCCGLRVRINGTITLRLNDPRPSLWNNNPRFGFHSFDPAVLRSGENRVVLSVTTPNDGTDRLDVAAIRTLVLGLPGYEGPSLSNPYSADP